jgi:hypothetical protein
VARRNKFKKYEACDKVQRGCSSYKAAGPKSCLIQGISGDKNNQLRSPTGLPDVLQILVLVCNLSKKTSITEPRLQLLKFPLCVDTLVTSSLSTYFSLFFTSFIFFLISPFYGCSIFRFTLLPIFTPSHTSKYHILSVHFTLTIFYYGVEFHGALTSYNNAYKQLKHIRFQTQTSEEKINIRTTTRLRS